MRLTPKDWALALALATRRAPEKEAAKLTARLVALMTKRGNANLLPRVLAALPKAFEEAAAANRVNVESSRELTPKTLKDILAALGIDEDAADVKVTVSPSLIGGVRVRQRDRVTDLTVSGRIAKLRDIGRRKA
jgi:F0F1-type ATP synthase delta subunit